MPKYYDQEVLNDTDTYQFLFDSREVPYIIHYKLKIFSPKFKQIEIEFSRHIWKNGDKLYKLANRYYGSYDFWWVLALVNKKFTDSDFTLGDEVIVPRNPQQIIDAVTEFRSGY